MAKTPSSSTFTTSSAWLQLYFVLASLLGLSTLVLGISIFINTLLNMTVLKPRPQRSMPPTPYFSAEMEKFEKGGAEFTEDEKVTIDQWKQDYAMWEADHKDYDYETEGRKRSLAFAIALIAVGTPVFALHAPTLFKSARK